MHQLATPSPAASPLSLPDDLIDEKEVAALLDVAVGQRLVRYSRADLASPSFISVG